MKRLREAAVSTGSQGKTQDIPTFRRGQEAITGRGRLACATSNLVLKVGRTACLLNRDTCTSQNNRQIRAADVPVVRAKVSELSEL